MLYARSVCFQWGWRARGDSAVTLGGFTAQLSLALGSAEPGPAVTSSHQDCPQCATQRRGPPGGRSTRGSRSQGTQQPKRGAKMKIIPLCINAVSSVWESTQSAAAPTFFTRAFTCITLVLAVKNTTGSASQKMRLLKSSNS